MTRLSFSKPSQLGEQKKTMKTFLVILIIILLLTSAAAAVIVPIKLPNANKQTPFHVGVSFCGNTTAEAKLLIDRVSPYTNLFVFQSFPLRSNQTAVEEVCDYAAAQGLHVMVNLGVYQNTWTWQMPFLTSASERYGSLFEGVYYDDEPIGVSLDYPQWYGFFAGISNYLTQNATLPARAPNATFIASIAEIYNKLLAAHLNGTAPQDYNAEVQWITDYMQQLNFGLNSMKNAGIKTFTSDYALYWFDYLLGGYDVMLSQFGANNSYVQNIDLIRGAARLQDKDWGAIITWKYLQPPYLDTGEEIYQQMLAAYQSGAKYIIIFDYPQMPNNPYGVLQEEHFAALEKFSNDVMGTSKMRTIRDDSKAQVVLVLPNNYGFGLRRADDSVWGFWGPDDKAAQVWNITQTLIGKYGVHLDIVYDDPAFPVTGKYANVYFWNETL